MQLKTGKKKEKKIKLKQTINESSQQAEGFFKILFFFGKIISL